MNINISEALNMIPRSVISIIVLFFVTKIIGKKQVSQLSLFDYVIGISIGNFTAEMVMDLDNQYINGIVAIISFGLVSYLVSYITAKSIIIRRFIVGIPTVIIDNGKISLNGLKKAKIDINDLLEQCRNQGYFDISEISYALMEANGKISILPKIDYQVPSLIDLNIKKEKEQLTANVIIDGKLMIHNLENINKDIKWLDKELIKKGHNNYKHILLATVTNNKLIIYEKNNLKSKKILE